jgi:hypothetical protein
MPEPLRRGPALWPAPSRALLEAHRGGWIDNNARMQHISGLDPLKASQRLRDRELLILHAAGSACSTSSDRWCAAGPRAARACSPLGSRSGA